MKKRSLIMLLVLALAAMMVLAACGGGADGSGDADAQDTETVQAADDQADSTDPTDADTAEATDEEAPEEGAEAADVNAITVDKEAGTVSLYAEVNGMFFDQSTMHCVVNKDGGAGDKAMFAAYADSQDFYDALEEAGGTPWNTTTDKIASGEFTDGQKVDVSFTWDGQDTPVPLADMIRSDSGKVDVDMRFSGNKDNNKEAGSGCIACLNSCWAGICSNAAYGYDAIDSGKPTVYLDDSAAPEDGTVVKVTFTLK